MMQRVTINEIDRALAAAGIDARIARGRGYFYFYGDAISNVFEQGVYGVAHLNDLSVAEWVALAREKSTEQ